MPTTVRQVNVYIVRNWNPTLGEVTVDHELGAWGDPIDAYRTARQLERPWILLRDVRTGEELAVPVEPYLTPDDPRFDDLAHQAACGTCAA